MTTRLWVPLCLLIHLPLLRVFLKHCYQEDSNGAWGKSQLLERLSSISSSSSSSYSYYYYYKFPTLSISLPFLPYNNSHQTCLEVSSILLAIERNAIIPIFSPVHPLLVLIHLNLLLFALERNLLFVRVRNPMFASNKCFVKLLGGWGGDAICQRVECTANTSSKFLSNPSSFFLPMFIWENATIAAGKRASHQRWNRPWAVFEQIVKEYFWSVGGKSAENPFSLLAGTASAEF